MIASRIPKIEIVTIMTFIQYAWAGLILLGTAFMLGAQDTLGLEQAIQTALKNNYQIRLRQYDVETSTREADPALVGRKPTINLNANYQGGWSDASTETQPLGPEQQGNNEINLSGISNSISVGPELQLLLLDGKESKYRLEQLQTAGEATRLQLRQTVEQTAAEVSSAYLRMARQQSLMRITRQSIALNRERLERSIQDAEFGTSGSLEQLQIEVDLKTDSAELRNLRLEYENARRNLNHLMGQDPKTTFAVDTALTVNTQLQLNELSQALRQNNTLLQLSEKNVQLANLDVDIRQAAYKPTLQGYANVTYSYLRDEASFLTSTRSVGPNIGLQFSMPIFDGGARKIREQNAITSLEQQKLERSRVEEELIKELYNAYAVYRNTLEQLRIERSNLESFEQNLENMRNLYELGQATNTDVRSAQLNLNAAQNRINNFQYTIKEAEVQLYLLSGRLVE